MKGIIAGILSILIGGGITYGVIATSEETPDKKESDAVVTTTNIERTVDLDENKPWGYAPTDMIEGWLSEGETVYLFEDGDALMQEMNDMASSDNKHKAEHLESYNKYLKLYVQQMKRDYPEKGDYLNDLLAKGESLSQGSE